MTPTDDPDISPFHPEDLSSGDRGATILPNTPRVIYRGLTPGQKRMIVAAMIALVVCGLVGIFILSFIRIEAQQQIAEISTYQALEELTSTAQARQTEHARATQQFFQRETQAYLPTDTPIPPATLVPSRIPIPTRTPDPLEPIYELIRGAILDYDRARRLALETGDTSLLYQEAVESALADRLEALRILRGCHWQYDYRGIDFRSIQLLSESLAEVRAVLDIDGTVFCGSREYRQYAFEGPVDVSYVVKNIDGEWIVSDVESN